LPLRRPWVSRRTPIKWLKRQYDEFAGKPTVYEYQQIVSQLLPPEVPGIENYPSLIPNWDNTPRSGGNGLVLHGSTPDLFRIHARQVLERVLRMAPGHNLVFIKSWNEWAEGNYVEPDVQFGHKYLEVIRDVFSQSLG
jgi:hypothetical protein